MLTFRNGTCLTLGAVLGVLAWGSPGQATYGGGACHRCGPAPVVQTQAVALAPQCQTVQQTVYETVV